MTVLIKSLLRKTAYLCAFLVIMLVILAMSIRILTPGLDQYRNDAETLASALLHTPVTIKHLRLSWNGFQPEIRLDDVIATSPDTHQPILAVQRVSVFISLFKSMWQMKWVPSGVMFSGSSLSVTQAKNGKVAVQGFPDFGTTLRDQPFQAQASIIKLSDWLSLQPDIILDNIHLRYKYADTPEEVVTLYRLSLENVGNKHTILGKAILQQTRPVEVTTAIQWEGSGADLATIKANAYFDVNGFSLTQWFKEHEWKGWQFNDGMVNAKIWLDWSDSRLQKVEARFQGAHLGMYSQINKASQQIHHLTGLLKWQNQHTELEINSQRLQFIYDPVFANPVTVKQLNGKILLDHDPDKQTWQVTVSSLQLMNSDGMANVAGSFQWLPSQLPNVNLDANFTLAKASHVSRYLPLNVFPADVSHWLSDSFTAGEVTAGHAQLKGNLADFPFDKGNGKFLITGDVKNVGLTYAPNWPDLEHINGRVVFAGSSVHVEVDSGETLTIPFGHVVADIPDMGAAVSMLNIKTDPMTTDFSNALGYVRSSPLNKTLGKMFNDVSLSGPIDVDLAMKIPMHRPESANIVGQIKIDNAVMKFDPWNLEVDQLSGLVHFTESTTDSSSLTGELFGRPLELSLATLKKKHTDSIVRANFKNHIAVSDLQAWLKLPLSTVMTGDTDISGELDMAFDKPINLLLQSKLVGIDVNLPDQYGKKASQSIDFNATLTIEREEPLKAQMTYGKLLTATAMIDRDELGEMSLESAGLTSDKMMLYGQQLTNVKLDLTPSTPNWHVNVASNEITGQVDFPIKLSRQSTVTAVLDKLNIQSSNITSITPTVNPSTFPTISIVSNNTVINKISLGKLTIKTAPSKEGLTIQTLRIVSPMIDFQASGAWTGHRQANLTTLTGNAVSNNVHDFLMNLGFDAHNVVVQNGRMRFDVAWDDVPYSLAFAKMNGTASFELSKGRIVDIGEENGAKMGLGRMLSLFSLQTIPRRLSLDFSDVFQKGYSFDTVKGDFKIDNGDIYTSNVKFDGPVAKIGINGKIGLTDHDYNLVLSVTPYVTSSIPVAATLLTGNPLIGLGVFAVNTVVSSQVSKVSTYYYNVTGPWNNPSWKTISAP